MRDDKDERMPDFFTNRRRVCALFVLFAAEASWAFVPSASSSAKGPALLLSHQSASAPSERLVEEDTTPPQQQQQQPPFRRPENLNKFQQEFRDKIFTFACYTDEDIASIANKNFRALYEGVAAGAVEPAVYRAFEVLFEELPPIRLAGRAIYGQLTKRMDHARSLRKEQTQHLTQHQQFTEAEVKRCLLAYQALCGDKTFLTMKSFIDSGAAEEIVLATNLTKEDEQQLLSADGLKSSITADRKGRIPFDELVLVLEDVLPEGTSTTQVLERAAEAYTKSHPPLQGKKLEFSKQYDNMVETFKDWEEYSPTKEGAFNDVLRGCFVGARNPKVVNALKIVYIDYLGLRVAGDLVFKLMKSIVRKAKSKKQS